MSDLIAGLGIALVLEGLLWALAPEAARRMLTELAGMPTGRLQVGAVAAVAVGVALFWLAKA